MLLEKLEIKGFKSFGDKITINFDEGITGIVGPNGCGKSNIVDAIRWVLGEQRIKALRSEKMENIIFNGTKKRKALQLAEVSLTFSNTKNILPTEYSSVTITRRYYRSGDSEYELNGIKCRLKDITNLFMDTGITSNSYAIIELAMVDDILNDKENARRGLFEEAAGISKFKKRKRETLRRLEETDLDLDRVEDLLFEIETNLKSLEKQARQAERYYKLKDEYKEQSIQMAQKNLAQHRGSFDTLNKQIQDENDKKISLTKQVAEKEAEISKLKTDLITREKTLATRQKALNDHVSGIRQYESDKKIKNERLRFLNDKSANLKEQIEQDKKSLDRASFSIESLINEKTAALKILEEIRTKLETLRDEKETQASKTSLLQAEVNALSDVYKNKREEVFNLIKSVEIKEIQITSLKQELDKTSTDTTEQSASLVAFEKKTKEIEENLKNRKKAFTKLRESEETTQKRITDTEKTVEVIREEVNQINRKLDARQNEFNLTKSLIDNLEGFPEAIKFLKKESGWGKNVPLLSDVVTCTEEYRVTIENFLEPYMNYYVVDKEADAYKAVNLLSDASKGRAHFFILDSFEKYHASPSKIFDNASPASEIVEYDNKYKKLVSFLLDNVYISDGDVKDIPKEDTCIFITKNGKVTKKRFSISGGSVGLFEGKKIGRVRNLEKLQKEIKKLESQHDKVSGSLKEKQGELEKLKAASHQHDIEELQLEINHINEEFISISTKHEQYAQFLNNTDIKKEDLLVKLDELSNELESLRPQSIKEDSILQETETKLNTLKGELSGQSSLHNEKSASFNEENINFHQHENKVNSLDQEIRYKKNMLDATSERIQKSNEDLKKNETEIRELVETTSSSDDVLVNMYKEKESLEEGVNEAEKDFYSIRGTIDQAERAEREIQHKREDIDTLLIELINRLNEIKIELNGVKERLSVEFNINIEELKLDDSLLEMLKDIDLEVLKDKVEKIRNRLENMGPINPMAMEAYDEIQQRHEFIILQRDDLHKAKESLLTTIEEIDLVAKATFLETFAQIKYNFVRVFRSLFTEEDDCDLVLSNPENPLESSIEIIAKPKGKKPLTINQLSGGEKTLTATSLLFSIYLIKPAPFCIFDEVDAPLDDANIDKFNNIIHKFSEESQFIIVTHNKRTMVSTDIIYGITMAEQGVSRVVPVDLRQLV